MCTICAQIRPYETDCPYVETGTAPAIVEPVIRAVITEGADAAGSAATAYSMQPGDSFLGSFATGADVDWVAITLTAGQSYTFGLNGSAGVDPILSLLDDNGNQLLRDDDGGPGLNSVIGFTATRTGTYYLRAESYGGLNAGGYELTAAVSAVLPVFTLDQIAEQLTQGFWAWSSGDPAAPERHFDRSPGDTITVNLTGLNADGLESARVALAEWSIVTGIVFREVTGSANISFDDNQAGAFASSSRQGGTIISSHVNISTSWLTQNGEEYFYQTYLHEIGHALGLGHAGNYNGSALWGVDSSYANDSWQATVMSYFNQDTNPLVNATRAYIATPMLADIIAIQNLYGTPTGVRAGNTTYGVNSNAGGVLDHIMDLSIAGWAGTIFDQGGIDTLNLSTAQVNQRIDLRAEAHSDIQGGIGNLSIARGTVIENAVGGSGNDTIIGNDATNSLIGGDGNDSIDGGLGNDWLTPGRGNDTVDGSGGNDMVNFSDMLERVIVNLASGTAASGANANVLRNIENVTGSSFADLITGDGGNNSLRGLGGYDWFNGSGGSDTFDGGSGRDMVSYIGSTARVIVDLRTGAGSGGLAEGDTYISIERARGSRFDDIFWGGTAPIEDFSGHLGSDLFMGSAGRDAYHGGDGIDTASYSNATSGGITASLMLGRGTRGDAATDVYVSIENLTGSNFSDRLTGDDLNNVLTGLRGDDFIFGGGGRDRIVGGAGNDEIVGGAGNDEMDGGAGIDHAVFAGLRSQYSILTAAGVTTVSHIGGTLVDGIDRLTGIEELVFSDGTFLL